MTDPVPPVAADASPDLPGRAAPDADTAAVAGSALHLLESLNVRRVELELTEQTLRAECESLSGQRDRYRSLFDTLPLPAVVMEPNGSLCGANDLALELLGIDETDVIRGRRLCASLGPRCQQAMVQTLARRQRVAQVDADLYRADGGFTPCTLHLSPLPGGETPQWLVVLDPSSAPRTAPGSAAQASFLAHMGHEVRTPVANLQGLLQLALDAPLTPEQRRHLTLASESASDLLTIANDIVDLSRIEAGALALQAVPLSPREVVQASLDKCEAAARAKGLHLSASFAADVPDLWIGDPVRLRQVLANLIGNAVKFTAQGHVRVELSRLPDTPAGGVVLAVTVQDSGIGFDAAVAARLFSPFVQADPTISPTYGGAGLGLSISRQLVELMGGTIACSSEPGRGAVFRFTLVGGLPAAPSPASAAPDPGTGQRVAVRPLHVLVAEDQHVNQVVVRSMLETLGHACTVVADGQAAVEAIRTGSFDLVMMDEMMPVMDGLSAVRTLRSGGPDGGNRVPVVMLTAHAMTGDRERFLAAGADGYLSKPVNLETLRHELARVLAA